MAGFVKAVAKIWDHFAGGFAGDVEEVIKNPLADLPTMIVVVGIILAALFLVVTIVVLAVSMVKRRYGASTVVVVEQEKEEEFEGQPRSQEQEGPRRVRLGAREWFLGWGLFALIMLALLSAGNWYTSQPSFCRNCHLMETAYKGWEKSNHKDVGCLGCHQTPGVSGFGVRRLNYLRETLAMMTTDYSSPRSRIDNNACLKCHANIATEVVTQFNVRVRHRDFLGDSCSSCHSTVGHGEETRLKTEPTMSKCLVCHDNRTATADCSACHVKDVGVKMRRPKRGKIKIMVSPVENCRGCHSVKKCTEHHGTEMPHQMPQWLGIHGKIAGASNNPICWRCHETDYSFCRRCHQATQPHPDNWRAIHKFVVRGQREFGLKECKNCHSPDACQGCHEPGGLGIGPPLPNIEELLKWEWKREPLQRRD